MIISLLLLINLYGLIIMFIDKQKAKRHQWRVSEAHLWIVSLIGGAVGIFAGMQLFRHKTKHTSFRIGIPVLIVLQIALYIYLSANGKGLMTFTLT
ncbi:DUF1294 domain-containing protein [Alkalihalobacillus sp. TS-13]|uniref:DUF1294 domain-containing protein n=1 Tax=Alkalihalobacillus sp. TS-13 TaxID=2842455 RepID=UPI001C88AB6F|nr:DUF1294 domain-containing protein [Alkalihalobacillus sp. TS-13]